MEDLDKKKQCLSHYSQEESQLIKVERLLSEAKGLLEVETEKRKLLERQLKEERQIFQKEKMLRAPGSEHCLQIEVEKLKREKELIEYENTILKKEIKRLSDDFENFAGIASSLKIGKLDDHKHTESQAPTEMQNRDELKHNLIDCPTIFDDSYNSKLKDDKLPNEKSVVVPIYNDHPNDLGSDINNREDESEYMKTELMQQLYTDVRSQKSNMFEEDKLNQIKNLVNDKNEKHVSQSKVAVSINDLFNGDDDAYGFDSFLKPISPETATKHSQMKSATAIPPPKMNRVQPLKSSVLPKSQQVAPKPTLPPQANKIIKKPITSIFDDNEDEVDVFQFN